MIIIIMKHLTISIMHAKILWCMVWGHQHAHTPFGRVVCACVYDVLWPRPESIECMTFHVTCHSRRAHAHRIHYVAYYCIQSELITYPAGEIEDCWSYGGVLVNRFPRLDQWPAVRAPSGRNYLKSASIWSLLSPISISAASPQSTHKNIWGPNT